MSAKLRQCRQGLAAALIRATNDVPEVECCSLVSSNVSGPVLYVSSSFSNDHPENLNNCSVPLTSHNHISKHVIERPDFRCTGQGCSHMKEDFFHSWTDVELLHDLPGMLETSSLQTLEELVAKLEFENELPGLMPPARADATILAHSGPEDGAFKQPICAEDDDHSSLLDTVLEMEQDYNLSVY